MFVQKRARYVHESEEMSKCSLEIFDRLMSHLGELVFRVSASFEVVEDGNELLNGLDSAYMINLQLKHYLFQVLTKKKVYHQTRQVALFMASQAEIINSELYEPSSATSFVQALFPINNINILFCICCIVSLFELMKHHMPSMILRYAHLWRLISN